MRRFGNNVMMGGILVAVLVVTALPLHAGTPKMVIESTKLDLGVVFEAKSYDYEFVVRNEGDADLRINKVKPNCGCTVADYDEIIPPGGTGRIHLTIDGKKVRGRFTKRAEVHTNDPNYAHETLFVAADIRDYVTISPSDKVYLRGVYGEPVEREVQIYSNELKENFKILDVSSNIDDKITYRVEPDASHAGSYTIKIFKNPLLPAEQTWGSLKLTTNSKNATEQIVQVNVQTKGSIVVEPATVSFGAMNDPETPVERTIRVFTVRGEFNIEAVEFSNKMFNASIETVTEGKQYAVTVAFNPDERRKSYDSEMVIRTSSPIEPSVRVPVIARTR